MKTVHVAPASDADCVSSSDVVVSAPRTVPLPRETNAYMSRMLCAIERQKLAVVDARPKDVAATDDTVDDEADALANYVVMTGEAWRATESLSPRMRHIKESLPLWRPDVSTWFTINTAGTHVAIDAESVPGIDLARHTLLVAVGCSGIAERIVATTDTMAQLVAAVAYDLWLDSFTVYTPPLFVLLNTCMPGVRRPVPATINSIQLAMFYLAYIKTTVALGYASDDDTAAMRYDKGSLKVCQKAMRDAERLRQKKLGVWRATLRTGSLNLACSISRTATFTMLRILETELIGLMRLPGFAVTLLVSTAIHTPVPELSAAEREADATGRQSVLAVMHVVWKQMLGAQQCLDHFKELFHQCEDPVSLVRAYMALERVDAAKSPEEADKAARATLALTLEAGQQDAAAHNTDETQAGDDVSITQNEIGILSVAMATATPDQAPTDAQAAAVADAAVSSEARSDTEADAPTGECANIDSEIDRLDAERRAELSKRDQLAQQAGALCAAWLAKQDDDSAPNDEIAEITKHLAALIGSQKAPAHGEIVSVIKSIKALETDQNDLSAETKARIQHLHDGINCLDARVLAASPAHRHTVQPVRRINQATRKNMPRVKPPTK